MTQLKTLPHVSTGSMPEVTFDTDKGSVEIYELDGTVITEVAFEDVTPAEFEAILDDVADHDEFSDEAEEAARSLLAQAKEQTDDGNDDTEPTPSPDEEDNTGEVVHVTEDGTEIRAGDQVNHPGGWAYTVTGREDDHTLRKRDNTDDWGVTIDTVERDVQKHGFAGRAEEC